jgi:hypothetical protein
VKSTEQSGRKEGRNEIRNREGRVGGSRNQKRKEKNGAVLTDLKGTTNEGYQAGRRGQTKEPILTKLSKGHKVPVTLKRRKKDLH